MKLNDLGKLFLNMAEEKGWGHTREMLNVSEKMMLINTEVTELFSAIHKSPKNPKDSIESETADILGRTLHLGLVWNVDFDQEMSYKYRFGGKKDKLLDSDYVYLYGLVSKGYDSYRHKRIKLFKKYLFVIAHEVVLLASSMNIDIKKAVLTKIDINKDRVWDKSKLFGNYYKGK
jgi:NTP pyrophosphatase (non-canonical NTP hydrolase)